MSFGIRANLMVDVPEFGFESHGKQASHIRLVLDMYERIFLGEVRDHLSQCPIISAPTTQFYNVAFF